MAKQSNYEKERNKYSTGVIIFLVTFSVLAIVITIFWQGFVNQPVQSGAPDLVRVPRVTTSIAEFDGQSRSVTAVFVVETVTGQSDDLDSEAISLNIRAILAGGSYERLTGPDSVEYARNLVQEQLPALMDMSSITNLHIVDLQAGNPNRFIIDDESEPPRGNMLGDFLRGLRFD